MRCVTAVSLPHSPRAGTGTSYLPQVGPKGVLTRPQQAPLPRHRGLDQILCPLSLLGQIPGQLGLYGNSLPKPGSAEMEPSNARWPRA